MGMRGKRGQMKKVPQDNVASENIRGEYAGSNTTEERTLMDSENDDEGGCAGSFEPKMPDIEDIHEIRILISQSKIKWGVVPVRAEYLERFDEVGHLSFGVEEQNVRSPEDGKWYV